MSATTLSDLIEVQIYILCQTDGHKDCHKVTRTKIYWVQTVVFCVNSKLVGQLVFTSRCWFISFRRQKTSSKAQYSKSYSHKHKDSCMELSLLSFFMLYKIRVCDSAIDCSVFLLLYLLRTNYFFDSPNFTNPYTSRTLFQLANFSFKIVFRLARKISLET